MPVDCRGTNTLSALVAGALRDSERAAIANHAAFCDRCQALIEGLIDSGTRATIHAQPACDTTPRTAAGLVTPRTAAGATTLRGVAGPATTAAVGLAAPRTAAGATTLRATAGPATNSGPATSRAAPGLAIPRAAAGPAAPGASLAWLVPGAPPAWLAPGARVGRYVIEAPLGAGGMGVVYAAVDAVLHRRVAVKLLRPDAHGFPAGAQPDRLVREARALARLSHPNVVTVFNLDTHGDHLVVAMELVEGASLRSWLRDEPRSTDEILDRLLEVGRGLAEAHAAGVVHRDVKPDNILIGRDQRARVTDFGLAHLGDPPAASRPPLAALGLDGLCAPTPGVLAGTPPYMAPEQLLRRRADSRSDQWSFCATLYESLAGVRPFPDDLAARIAAIAQGRLASAPARRRVPGWVRPILQRGLDLDPAARWPSMAALVNALARTRGRRKRRATAIVCIAIAAAVIGDVLLGRGEPPRLPPELRLTAPDALRIDPPPAREDTCPAACEAPAHPR